MVVTEWQVDLDARLDTADDAAGSADSWPIHDERPDGSLRYRPGADREESHVALEIDPADEGVSQP
jgi:hypothetical protein